MWHWTFDQLRKGLNTTLSDHHFLAACTPQDGVVRSEYLGWLASGISHKSPLLFDEVPVSLISESIAKLRRDHPMNSAGTIMSTSGGKYPWTALNDLESAVNSGRGFFRINLYPRPDLDATESQRWILRYSKDQVGARVARIYEQAGVAYCEIVAALFPNFGGILRHEATFPAVLEGILHHDPIGMGDFGDTTISFGWKDNVTAPAAPPVTCEIQIVEDSPDAWILSRGDQQDQSVPDDPGREAFGLFGHWTASDVDPSMYGARPATVLALDWLAEDLKSLGWLDSQALSLR